MKKLLKSSSFFLAGVLFGAGLSISQMIDPEKVLSFLDIFGDWDPSLLLVMAGGVLVSGAGILIAKRMQSPLLAERFPEFLKQHIDISLITGAVIFGAGWGIVGLCPGPAVVSIIYLKKESFIFMASMLAGMGMMKLVRRLRSK